MAYFTEPSPPMRWHVHYTDNTRDRIDHIDVHASPEDAIETACRLLDEGRDVPGIGADDVTVGKQHVARIYALWSKARKIRRSDREAILRLMSDDPTPPERQAVSRAGLPPRQAD